MKRKIASIIAFVLALCTLMATGAMAASADTGVTVRVNGYTVSFPDGQPYIDANSRTMIPVRFVTEQLGAEVSWNGNTETAIIEKDGICVEIPIGSDTLNVTQDGTTTAVKMDTSILTGIHPHLRCARSRELCIYQLLPRTDTWSQWQRGT